MTEQRLLGNAILIASTMQLHALSMKLSLDLSGPVESQILQKNRSFTNYTEGLLDPTSSLNTVFFSPQRAAKIVEVEPCTKTQHRVPSAVPLTMPRANFMHYPLSSRANLKRNIRTQIRRTKVKPARTVLLTARESVIFQYTAPPALH